MAKRVVGWLAALLVGIASASLPVTAAAVPSDEQQIRDVVAEQLVAIKDLDGAKLGALFCRKYRARVEADTESMGQAPPMDMWPTGADYDTIYNALRSTFEGVSQAALKKLARAIVDGDEVAYEAAWHQVWKELWTPVTMEVRQVTVLGDAATAVVIMGGIPRVDATPEDRSFVREDGEWKDCTDSDFDEAAPRLGFVPDAIGSAPDRLANAIAAPR